MIKFQDEMQNLTKFTHFEKFIFVQQWLTQNVWLIGAAICIFDKQVEKYFIQKNFHVKKWKKN